MSTWFSKAKRQKIASSICDCGSPAETILRDVPQCARCAALEKQMYPSGWAGVAAKKHRPLIESIEYPLGVVAPWLRNQEP